MDTLMGNSYVFHAPVVASAPLEWAIDFRTLFEDTCAKPRESTGKNNCAVYIKGMTIANLHGTY